MKTKFTLVFVMLFALTATKMYAQDKKGLQVGLGVEGALPIGSFGNAYNVGAGVTLRLAYALDETSAITATTGAMAFIPKSITGLSSKASLNIPIKAGYRHMLSGSFYGLGEAGFTIARVYAPTVSGSSGSVSSVSSTSFTYSVGVGTKLGAFDPSIRYEGYSGAGFIGLRLGFNF